MNEKNYRAEILKSAAEIVRTQGIRALTISNIVQRSRISNRNFYQCFSTKEALLLELKDLLIREGIEITDQRQQILEKAEEMIAVNGFNNITLEGIAQAAGMSRGVIYKYFSDKYELLECSVQYQFERLKGIISMIYQQTIDEPEAFFNCYIKNYADFLNNSFDSSIYTEVWSHLNYREKIRIYALDVQEFTRGVMRQCINNGIDQGVFHTKLDLKPVTDLIMMIINGMAFSLSTEGSQAKISDDTLSLILDTVFQTLETKERTH